MRSPEEIADALGRYQPTPEQSAIISAPLTPRLVIAGAGSGKTETIAARVVYLVVNGLAEPDQVLGLTFTRKAAAELGQRIRRRLHEAAERGLAAESIRDGEPVIGTYHAYAARIIDEFGPLAGIQPAERVLTATESWQLARRVVSQWDRDLDTDRSPAKVTEDLLAITSALADHLVDAHEVEAHLRRLIATIESAPIGAAQRNPIHHKLDSTYRSLQGRLAAIPLVLAFTQAKRDMRVVDFADQMQLTARLVTQSGRVGEVLRERHGVVMLDEYQDTGHSQRVILRALYGAPPGVEATWRGHPVTAVGDPVQSIYGWRGASASNLPRFTVDFPQADGGPAPVSPLLISFRNDQGILAIANAVSEPIRSAPVEVGELRPGPVAGPGRVDASLHDTVTGENDHLAAAMAEAFAAGGADQSMAVLVRRRATMAPIAAALRERGLPVEVVGVGGLIDEPEVADVIALLRMVVDHESGSASVRLLTGARWRLGIRDLAALSTRARELVAPGAADPGTAPRAAPGTAAGAVIRRAMADALAGEDGEDAGLVSALADPGDAARYSPAGWRRIRAIGSLLDRLRARLNSPLPELIGQIVRGLGLDVEVELSPDGRAHLDALDEVVAALPAAGPVELLDYLTTAAEREDGLAPGQVAAQPGRIQILTVHAAKGLEWDVVAIPSLSAGVFPGERTSVWLTDSSQLPPDLRGDSADLPSLTLSADVTQKDIADRITEHRQQWKERQATEERRLFYVAVTRARHRLLLSAHHWSTSRKTPSGPSPLLVELHESDLLGRPEPWLAAPRSETNPELDDPRTGAWPIDPLGDRRAAIQRAADLVHAAESDPAWGSSAEAAGWARDAAALLAEQENARRGRAASEVLLPEAVSVSLLVDLAADPNALADRLRRPVPRPPAPQARRGTVFHSWLEHRFGGDPLLDLAELPGANDDGAADDGDFAALRENFLSSAWAARTPVQVEVPFITRIGGLTVRGRIDAVFANGDGTVTVVDWKTGAVPGPERARAAAIQLTSYRIAYARLAGLPLESVTAAFYYVAADRTVTPTDLLDADGLAQLIESSTVG